MATHLCMLQQPKDILTLLDIFSAVALMLIFRTKSVTSYPSSKSWLTSVIFIVCCLFSCTFGPLSLVPGRGRGSHRQSTPGNSRGIVGRTIFGGQAASPAKSGHVVCWTLQNHLFLRFCCTVAVGTRSGVLLPNTMEVRHYQRRVASTNLCYGDAPISGPVTVPGTVWWMTTRDTAMNSRVQTIIVKFLFWRVHRYG